MRNLRNNEDDQAQNLMADNVLEAGTSKEVDFCTHQKASKALETLSPYSSADAFEKFTSALLPNLRLLVNDSFGSFVLETCVKVATLRSVKCDTSQSESELGPTDAKKRKFNKVSSIIDYNLKLDVKLAHKTFCQQFVEKVSRFLMNNLEDYLHENANHLIRTCLQCLSGMVSQKNHFQKIEIVNLRLQHGAEIPESWGEVVSDFATRIMSWPQFPELAFMETSSVVLQILCQSLKNLQNQEEMLKALVKAVMRNAFKDEADTEDPEDFKAFSSPASLHLLEVMMSSCDEKLLNKMYKKYFKAKFMELCESPNLNFAVQRLIDAMTDKTTFEEIFNALSPEFVKLCQIGHTGILFSLCKACERLGVKQGQFIQSLLKALECGAEKTSKCIVPIITLKPLNVVAENEDESEITLHGSLILQTIFRFNKPIKIVQSLMDMKPQDIANIFCGPRGSRVADAYLESKYIGEKSREKLIKHLEGMYLKMALSKNGSHILEKFYKSSSDSQKEVIVKELSERVNQLNGSVSGRIINYKFSVESYARNVNQWKNFLARSAAKE